MKPEKIKEKIPLNILELIEVLNLDAKKRNTRLFFVGGLVRDILMGKKISDIDILVEGNAIDFVNTLNNVDVISYHPDFGTAKVKFLDVCIDFASTRTEIYPNSGCLPVVDSLGCSIEDDIKRRDFTVNSILINLETFEIIDFLGGINDIKNKKLKILHKNSFIDDPTRILRGLDFSHRFNFTLDNETKKLQEEYIKSNINRDYLSYSRVELTLRKLLNNNIISYNEIIDKNLYKIFRDTKPQIDFASLNSASFLFDVNPIDVAINILFDEIPIIEYDKNSKLNSYKKFKKENKLNLALYFAKTGDENILKYLEIKDIENKISGEDLISLGLKEGKSIGEALDFLLEYKIKNKKRNMTKEEEIDLINNKFFKKAN